MTEPRHNKPTSRAASATNEALGPALVLPAPGVSHQVLKRAFDLTFSVIGLLLLAPLGLLIALIIKLSDWGPVIYRQLRVGQFGKTFHILKFRTMVVDADSRGPSVTKDADPRITRIGALLRKAKLDELPQLWNVLRGDMTFVGPRPEVPKYVDRYTPEQRQILQFKPGITDLATLVFRDEQTLLRTATNVEEFYVAHCIPRKYKLNLQYAQRANPIEDFLIILETLCPYWLGVASGYALALGISLWLSYLLRFDFALPEAERLNMERFLFVIVPLQVVCLIWRKQVVGLLSYFDVPEMKQLAYGLGLAAAIQLLVWYVTQGDLMPARGIILIDAVLSFVILAGTRGGLRTLREKRASHVNGPDAPTGMLRVGIVGAGEIGSWLARQLNTSKRSRRRVGVFFDDDPDKWNKVLSEVPVVGMPECLVDGSWTGKLDEVILAMPSAKPERIQQVKKILASANIRARTMPSLEEILTG